MGRGTVQQAQHDLGGERGGQQHGQGRGCEPLCGMLRTTREESGGVAWTAVDQVTVLAIKQAQQPLGGGISMDRGACHCEAG